jgi:hypothetical protein
MQRIDLNLSVIAIMGLVLIISGCINSQDGEQKPGITQNITAPRSIITADVERGLVKLSHISGDDIPMSNFTIIIEQGDLNAIYERMGQIDDTFSRGDTLNITQDSVTLNRRKLDAKISINNSGVIGLKTTITLLSRGTQFARIVSSDGFFG